MKKNSLVRDRLSVAQRGALLHLGASSARDYAFGEHIRLTNASLVHRNRFHFCFCDVLHTNGKKQLSARSFHCGEHDEAAQEFPPPL